MTCINWILGPVPKPNPGPVLVGGQFPVLFSGCSGFKLFIEKILTSGLGTCYLDHELELEQKKTGNGQHLEKPWKLFLALFIELLILDYVLEILRLWRNES